MADTGSLLEQHYHSNKDVLDDLSNEGDYLYYKGVRVCEDYSQLAVRLMVYDMINELEKWEAEKYVTPPSTSDSESGSSTGESTDSSDDSSSDTSDSESSTETESGGEIASDTE